MFRVLRGNPNADELAALTAALRTRAAKAYRREPTDQGISAWLDRSRLMRKPLAHGHGAWRASGFPGGW